MNKFYQKFLEIAKGYLERRLETSWNKLRETRQLHYDLGCPHGDKLDYIRNKRNNTRYLLRSIERRLQKLTLQNAN
ncbi:MAG: hypothetical protein AABW50_00885 [Nanoarchaeota archaeon]